jgi:hypothetical protein
MSMLFALATGLSAHAAQAPFSWDWSRQHRYYLETQVELPTFVWLGTPFNKQARVTAFDLRLVTNCGDAEVETRKIAEVRCEIETVSLSARGMPQEHGLLQPILDELDVALSDSVVQLQLHSDGRVMNIDLEDALDRRNRRVGRINETLRLLFSRAFAGFDLALPEDPDETWVQYSSWLMRAPAFGGSAGGMELVNRTIDRSGNSVLVQSGGRGLIVPATGFDRFDARLASETWFDLGSGRMTDRTWTVLAAPTASSFIAQGTAGYPYTQRGRLVALGMNDSWDVGDSVELSPSASPSAFQQYNGGGLTPYLH